jgi:hypothetical protein
MNGQLRYVWERSTGKKSDTLVSDIPAGPRTDTVDITAKPDEWQSSERGVQIQVTNRLHVLSPVDKISPPIDVQLKCY